MAQRQRVRASRAARKAERLEERALVVTETRRLMSMPLTPAVARAAADALEVLRERRRQRKVSLARRKAKERLAKAIRSGWARGLSPVARDMTTARAYAA